MLLASSPRASCPGDPPNVWCFQFLVAPFVGVPPLPTALAICDTLPPTILILRTFSTTLQALHYSKFPIAKPGSNTMGLARIVGGRVPALCLLDA